MRLNNKVAILSGGAGGLGAAQAKLFSQEGAKIVIGDMDEVAGNELTHEINKNSGHAIFIRLDVLEEKNWREIVDASLTQFCKIMSEATEFCKITPGAPSL